MAEKFVIEYCKECDGKNDEICTQFIPVNHNNICHRCGHKKDSHTTFESKYMNTKLGHFTQYVCIYMLDIFQLYRYDITEKVEL